MWLFSFAGAMQSITVVFWSTLSVLILNVNALNYSNRWIVEIDGGDSEANRLARKHGFVNVGKVIDNNYIFVHEKVERISKVSNAHLHQGLMLEPNVKMVQQQEMKSYKLHSRDFKVNDPKFNDMWYINRDDGQPTYNVIDVWGRNITGAGVVVAVVDIGLDPEHPEIKANYDARASLDLVDNDSVPTPRNLSLPIPGHGNMCAGIIAGVLNNSNCGVGLAYKASIGGIRLFVVNKATDDLEWRAFSHQRNYIDIYSNSWGPGDTGIEVIGPGPLAKRALKSGAEEGRRGLGSIFVFSGGNGGLIVKDSCAFNGYVNSIYTIAITGINSDGSVPDYGENCGAIMAVTYSKAVYGDLSKVVTADKNKGCTESFGASSAAAAMGSGLIALMLSVNRDLTWRDVQHIIARTARPGPVRISQNAWTVNKANLSVNDYVGFGLMDATKMVDTALKWRTVPPKVNCSIPGPRNNRPIPTEGISEETIDLSNWGQFCGNQINYLEHVEVSVNLTYTRRGDLLIKLISPQGTVANLTHYRAADSFQRFTDLDWVVMTLHLWGENPVGSWNLTMENSWPQYHTNTGTLFNWTLVLHGTTKDPLANNGPVDPLTTDKPPFRNTTTKKSPTRSNTPSDETVLPTEMVTTEKVTSSRGKRSKKFSGVHSDQTVLLTKAFAPESQLTSFSKKKSSRSRGDWKIATGVVVAVAVAIGAGGGAKAYHSYRKKKSRSHPDSHAMQERGKDNEDTLAELNVAVDV